MDMRFWRGLAVGALMGWVLTAYGTRAMEQLNPGGTLARGAGRWGWWRRTRRTQAAVSGRAAGPGAAVFNKAASENPSWVAGTSALGYGQPRRRVLRAWRRREVLTASTTPIVTRPPDQVFAARHPGAGSSGLRTGQMAPQSRAE